LQTNDDELRFKTAAEWSKMFNAEILPEAVNCSGCLADDGVVFHHCTVCKIRACCRQKSVLNCAYCPDYGCDKITEIFSWVPEAKKALDEIRKTL
jgi:hypothetical protein